MTCSSIQRCIATLGVFLFVMSMFSVPGRRFISSGYLARAHAPTEPDKHAPDFTLTSLDGRPVSLHELRGKIVLLNFWATWCAPCKVETPWFVDIYQQYRPKGLEIVGVSMDDGGRDQVARFAKAYQINYPILLGNAAVADAYGGVRFLPQTYLLDADGKITKRMFGIQQKATLEADIQAAMRKQTTQRGY
jgi:peroxiredoxin